MIVNRIEERLKTFQRGKDIDDLRRKRDDGNVQLRKIKRSEHIAKKRALSGKVAQSSGDTSEYFSFTPEFIPAPLSTLFPLLLDPDQLSDSDRLDKVLDLLITSTDPTIMMSATKAVKQALSTDSNSPINYIGMSAAPERLISLLASENQELVIDALWAVTNLCAGSSNLVGKMMNNGLLGALVRLISSENEDIFEQTVWALSNIAGDSVSMRDLVVNTGVGDYIRDKLMVTSRLHVGIIAKMVWLLSNMCRGQPLPSESFVNSLFPVISIGIGMDMEEIQADICWICSYITDNHRANINEILNMRLVPRLLELMLSPNAKVQVPALRTVGNISAGDAGQTQELIVNGVLDKLSVVLTSRRKSTKKEALWCLSNIAAGNSEQRMELMRNPCLALAVQAVADPDLELKKEALWTLYNLSGSKDYSIVSYLLSKGLLKVLIEEMGLKDVGILHLVLGTVENLLRPSHCEDKASEAEMMFEALGGVALLEKMQLHENKAIYDKVVRLMDEFYGLMSVEDEPSQHSVPQGGFAFT